MDYVTIDFEASCLPRHGRSFPIEVGIAGRDGVRSWLIRPATEWHGWDWTREAWALHGISFDRLVEEGRPPREVFAELGDAIAGRRVIADSRIDEYWWRTLASAADDDASSPIIHVGTLLDELGASSDAILAAQRRADRLCPARHRAAADARWLWTLLETLESGGVEAHAALAA